MRFKCWFILPGMIVLSLAVPGLFADQLEMQNGDRYSGKVLSMSADTVVLDSEVLGKINVPRKKVATLIIGANVAALKMATNITRAVATENIPAPASAAGLANTNVDLSMAFHQLGGATNFIGQIRQQMLAGSPEAAGKYDALVNGLLTGKLNLDDLRREAGSDANQLRELKRELGPEAGESIDAYLDVLNQFLKETAGAPPSSAPMPEPKSQAP